MVMVSEAGGQAVCFGFCRDVTCRIKLRHVFVRAVLSNYIERTTTGTLEAKTRPDRGPLLDALRFTCISVLRARIS